METFEELLTRVHKENTGLDVSDSAFKTIVVEEAFKLVGPSDTAVAKFTGYSRGFVIPRVKKMKGTLASTVTAKTQVVNKTVPKLQKELAVRTDPAVDETEERFPKEIKELRRDGASFLF